MLLKFCPKIETKDYFCRYKMRDMKKSRVILTVILLLIAVQVSAQSDAFKLGKSLDIQYSILKEVSNSYVDTIKFDKFIKIGIDAMLESLDPYTVYIPEENEEKLRLMTTGTYGGIGAIIKKKTNGGVIISEPYEGSPAAKSGLLPGDQIIEIDGVSVIGETSQQSTDKMKGQPGTNVKFKVVRGRSGDTLDVVVIRERIHISDIEYAGMIRDSIGYIKISGFTAKMSKELRDNVLNLKAKGAKRLVLDLRGNGGGLMEEATDMVSLFVPKGTLVVSSKGRVSTMNQEIFTTEYPIDTLIPLMVMVNSGSASSSEIVAGALQDLDRATIAGKRTFGKGLIQSIQPVAYNGKIKVTTGKYYTPSGRCVQAIDYSQRNEDGSVGSIPDSLIREFKTKKGRSVYDGGGIAPDIETETHLYSRPTVSLFYNDIIGDYAIEYFKKHSAIVKTEDFYLTDTDYENFVKYADGCEFDYRSSVQTQIDQMIKSAKLDGIYDTCKKEIDALASKIDMDKETMLKIKKSEIKPLIEEEIVVKYYFRKEGSIIGLRDDSQLYEALDKW